MTSTTQTPPPPPLYASSDSDADSDSSSTAGSESLRHSDLSATIFKSYTDINGPPSSSSSADLFKIQSFLTSSRSGALSCLICLERIRPSDPTWSCSSRCFAVFHLVCIQSWARQSSVLYNHIPLLIVAVDLLTLRLVPIKVLISSRPRSFEVCIPRDIDHSMF